MPTATSSYDNEYANNEKDTSKYTDYIYATLSSLGGMVISYLGFSRNNISDYLVYLPTVLVGIWKHVARIQIGG